MQSANTRCSVDTFFRISNSGSGTLDQAVSGSMYRSLGREVGPKYGCFL